MGESQAQIKASLRRGPGEDIKVELRGNTKELLDLHAYVAGTIFYSLLEAGVEKEEALISLVKCVQKGLSREIQLDVAISDTDNTKEA